jgi:excisionase family DNA binding protein
MTVAALAHYLHCHPGTIYRLLKRKQLPGFRLGGDWRFFRADIDVWIATLYATNPLDGERSLSAESKGSWRKRGRKPKAS